MCADSDSLLRVCCYPRSPLCRAYVERFGLKQDHPDARMLLDWKVRAIS